MNLNFDFYGLKYSSTVKYISGGNKHVNTTKHAL